VGAGIGLLALIGFARYLLRRGATGWQAHAWAIFALLGALLLVSFVRFNFSFFQAQARYLFPALPPAAIALALGLEEWAPVRFRSWVSPTAAILLGAFAFLGLMWWIAPEFLLS
jgi:putative effector of murein hydrolase